jgi:hypothetical protein
MLSEKENYKMLLRGEIPEFVPKYRMMEWMVMPSLFRDLVTPDGYKTDEFGVIYATTPASMGAHMAAPGKELLKDIRKWRDVIKTPDLSNVDWEALAKKDLENKDIQNDPVCIFAGGYFMTLMDFMSFTEGLCAMHEEPEEVYALFEYLSEYYLEKQRAMTRYYHPDVYCLVDDTAAAKFPFISEKMYRELVMPFHKKHADMARDDGLLISMHCCGRCESFADAWTEMGVSAWEPAQVSNDLAGMKKKFGRRLAIMGGWDNTGRIAFPETSDEELREALCTCVDTLAPDGGYAFMAFVNGDPEDEAVKRKNGIVEDVYQNYAKTYYQTH